MDSNDFFLTELKNFDKENLTVKVIPTHRLESNLSLHE